MSIKILGGLCKGTTLEVPSGSRLRPTSVLLKRRLFDSFQNLSSNIFVDCCAGVGGIGLEAWSRHSQEVYLVELDRLSFSYLERNVSKIKGHYPDEFHLRKIFLHKGSVQTWLRRFLMEYQSWPEERKAATIFFLDPPYAERKLYFGVIEQLKDVVQMSGQLWVESSILTGPSQEEFLRYGLTLEKSFGQGDSFISIFRF